MINVNHEKSSSRAVYEYFTNKHKDIKTSDVSKNLHSSMRFSSSTSCSKMTEIEGCVNFI
jgi:hypothetical protein